MSRPMALGLILLVLFLTSQSDWKPPKEGQDESEVKGSKADLHREEIKEKVGLISSELSCFVSGPLEL